MIENAGLTSELTIGSANKIVVFDLDETLGYFVELGLFWDCLQTYLNKYDAQFIMGLPHDTDASIRNWVTEVLDKDFPLTQAKILPLS